MIKKNIANQFTVRTAGSKLTVIRDLLQNVLAGYSLKKKDVSDK